MPLFRLMIVGWLWALGAVGCAGSGGRVSLEEQGFVFDRRTFSSGAPVEAIQVLPPPTGGRTSVVVLSAATGQILDSRGFTAGRLVYPSMADPRVVRSRGELLVYSRGAGYGDVIVSDGRGGTLWRYPPKPGVPATRMTAGDLDADGDAEFYVADGTLLRRLNSRGEVVWDVDTRGQRAPTLLDATVWPGTATVPPSVFTVAAVAEARGGTVLRQYDVTGKLLATVEFPVSEVREVAAVEDDQGHPLFVCNTLKAAVIVDGAGKVLRRHDLAVPAVGFDAVSGPLHPRRGRWLAIVSRGQSPADRAVLQVWDEAGQLVRQDELKSSGGLTIGVLDGRPTLLVGDAGRVWAYTLTQRFVPGQ